MNQTLQLVKERVRTLDPKDVEAYLQSRGWEADPRASSANGPTASQRGAAPEPAVADRFHDLARRWKQETRFCSSRNQLVNHPAYQEIIRLGKAAVPFLIEDLRAEPHYWFPALQAIT